MLRRTVAVVLIVGGVLALIYGGFTYSGRSHDLDLGVVELSVTDRESVAVPVWAGVAAVVIGIALLVGKRRA